MKNSELINLVGADSLNEAISRSWKMITAIADGLSETDNYRKIAIRSKYLDFTIVRIPVGYEIMPLKKSDFLSDRFVIEESLNPYVSCTFGLTELGGDKKNNSIDVHILTLEDEIITSVRNTLIKKKSIFPSNKEFTYYVYPRPYQGHKTLRVLTSG